MIFWSCNQTGKFPRNHRFVLAAAPALAALARRRAGLHRRIVVAGSLAIALAGAGWFVARVCGIMAGGRRRNRQPSRSGFIPTIPPPASHAANVGMNPNLPSEARPTWLRGLAYKGKGDAGAALADFDEAIRLQPSYTDIFVAGATVRIEKKEFAAAIKDLDQAIRQKPSLAHAYRLRGLAWAGAGEKSKSDADARQAAELERKPK